MTHWGWYWKIKRKDHQKRKRCDSSWIDRIDSFKIYQDIANLEWLKRHRKGHILWTPSYALNIYVMSNNSLLVQYAKGSYLIAVEPKRCHYGGQVYFFKCPLCSKRMRMLYCIEGQYQCRNCGNLAYLSQRLRPTDRFAFKRIYIERYIKRRGGNLQYRVKPKHMHHATFKKILALAEYYDARANLADFQEKQLWSKRFAHWCEGQDLDYELRYIIAQYKKSPLYGHSFIIDHAKHMS